MRSFLKNFPWLKFLVAITLIWWILNLFFPVKPKAFQDDVEYTQITESIDGFKKYALTTFFVDDVALARDYFRYVSPDWNWIVDVDRQIGTLTLHSMSDPSKTIQDSNLDNRAVFQHWAPDGTAFIVTEYGRVDHSIAAVRTIIYNAPHSDEQMKSVRLPGLFSLSFDLFDLDLPRDDLVWLPHGEYLAFSPNLTGEIFVVDLKTNTIREIDVAKKDENISDFIWTNKGIFCVITYLDERYPQLALINPDNPDERTIIPEARGWNIEILGASGRYLLLKGLDNPKRDELSLMNIEAFEVEETFDRWNTTFEKTIGNRLDAPYLLLKAKSDDGSELWVFDWKKRNLKKIYVGSTVDYWPWTPKMNGVVILLSQNKDLEIWVAKP